jgi:hypothetical protein
MIVTFLVVTIKIITNKKIHYNKYLGIPPKIRVWQNLSAVLYQ